MKREEAGRSLRHLKYQLPEKQQSLHQVELSNRYQYTKRNIYILQTKLGSPASASSLSNSDGPKDTKENSETKDNVGRELLQSPHESLVAGCRQLYTALLLRVLEERVIATPR